MNGADNSDSQYDFVPEHLRHHFHVGFFGGDEQEKDEIRCARRTRSAHLVSSALEAAAVTPGSKLYSQSVEHAIMSRMTFDRTLTHLEEYFKEHSVKLRQLENTQPLVVPEWLYDASVKLPTLLQVQRYIVQAVESCLNDSDVYLAMSEPLPSPPMSSPTPLLRFPVCSSKSSMAHQILLRTPEGYQSISPHAYREELYPNQDQEQESGGERKPSNQRKRQLTVSFEALESMNELVIEDIEAYSPGQIHRFTADTITGPFACFPLLNSSKSTAIGVLSIDSCRRALRLRPESMTIAELSEFLTRKNLKDVAIELRRRKFNGKQFLAITERDLNHKPMFASLKINTRKRILELVHALKKGATVHLARPVRYFVDDPDAMRFLHNLSISSGIFLEGFRGVHSHRVMANITRDPGCSVYDVYDALLCGITQSVDFVARVVLWKIKSKHSQHQLEIDVMASTQIPDDRLMPFLQWSERQIKHVVLYKEGFDIPNGSVHLVQGTIMRIVLPNQDDQSDETTTSAGASKVESLCERAQYQVSWSNRTVERYTWAQLRQLLPIRAMNVKHFQLTHLLERLERDLTPVDPNTIDHQSNGSLAGVVRLQTPNGLGLVIRDSQCLDDAQYVLEVDFVSSSYEAPRSVIAFLKRAVMISEKSIACIRGRETRRMNRQLSSVRVSQAFHSMGLTPSLDALRTLAEVVARVFTEITDNLPGVEVQVAELQPDGAQLLYTFAANGSTLLDKVLNRGQGVSFRCFDSNEPLIVRRDSDLRSRLRRLGKQPASQEGGSEDAEFPYVFLPLFHEDCAVGVLSVNRFVDVPKGRKDENQPEAGVVPYLQSVIKSLGTAIYLKRRSYALYQLQILAHEPLRSPHQLMLNACRAVKDVLVGAWKVRIVEVDYFRGKTSAIYELSESERALESSQDFQFTMPIRLRKREMLKDTMSTHFNLTVAQLEEIYAHIEVQEQGDEEDARKIQQLLEVEGSTRAINAANSVPESEKRRLQSKRNTRKYFELLLSQADDLPTKLDKPQERDGSSRVSNEKYVNHALGVFLGSKTSHSCAIPSLGLRNSSVFLTSSSLPQFHASCELNYIMRVSEILSKLMDDLHHRVERSRARVRALEAFESICEQATAEFRAKLSLEAGLKYSKTVVATTIIKHALTPDEELAIEGVLALQRKATALIESIFYKTNVYIGLLEPSLRLIRFTSASGSSDMKGKQLKRGHGVSFQALDAQVPVVVTQRNAHQASDDTNQEGTESSLVHKLRFYSKEPREKQKWPFIVVPIDAFGVLSLDNLERYERLTCEPQPEVGVVDFLRQVASQIGRAIEATRKASRERRQTLRAQALTRIMKACDDVKTRSPMFLQNLVIQELQGAFNGVDAYIGMVQPLCEVIRFTCASTRSCMENQVVNTVDSASFRVFSTQRPLVIPQLQMYCRDQDQDPSNNKERLKIFSSSSLSSAPPSGPFVCVPIPFVGVLSVDTFPGAAGGIYTNRFPEKGVVEFLSQVANHLGENVRTHSALAACKQIPELFEGNKGTLQIVFQELLQLIAGNLVAAEEMQVARFSIDSWQEKPQLATLKRSKFDQRTVSIDALKYNVLQQIRSQHQSGIGNAPADTDASCFTLSGVPEVIVAVLEPTRNVEDDDAALLYTAIVLRRVGGVTWMYDLEFVKSILPLVNDLIVQMNIRIEGIVARRRALKQVDQLCHHLDGLAPQVAMDKLHGTVKEVLEQISEGLSRGGCDVYMGEREIGGEKLTFTCASSGSLMENVSLSLSDEANQSLVSVQCLEHKQPSVIHLLDGKNDRLLRSLTDKKCYRVHLVVSMGDDHILCADSLGVQAFHPKTKRIESDVVQFFNTCAKKLNEMIHTTRYRRSYDELVELKSVRHANFRLFFSTLLQIVRRDIVVLHSQQILTLASDFTGRYHIEAWHSAPTRRPLATSSDHFCYLNHCERHLISLGIHHDSQVQLPMTNLPRTLDESRSSLEPVEGVEKRGAFACSCLATMLDAQMAAPRVALCVYTHDAKAKKARASQPTVVAPTTFTASQKQFFFALAAVAADVFTQVYRSCALYSFADEMFFHLREQLSAKEGLVIRVQHQATTVKTEHEDVNKESEQTKYAVVVLYSSQEVKYPRSSVLQGALAAKVVQFHQSNADFAIFVRKKLDAPPQTGVVAPRRGGVSAASQQPNTVVIAPPTDPKAQAKATSHSFFKRPDIFRSRKAKQQQEEQEQAAQQRQQGVALEVARDQILQHQPRFRFHVLLRGINLHAKSEEVFSFDVEHQNVDDGAKVIEQIAKRVRDNAQILIDSFLQQMPRGNEEMVGYILGQEAENTAYHVSKGGGLYLFSQLQQGKQAFQHASLGLETDIRGFLTGVQPAAHGMMVSGNKPGLDHKWTIPSPAPLAKSIFAEDDELSVAISQAAMVLLEASMLLVGFKKEALVKMDKYAMLKEYLRANVGKKLLDINPKDRKQWGLTLRAKSFLQSQDKAGTLQSQMIWLVQAPSSSTSPNEGNNFAQHSSQDLSSAAALQAMWILQATLISIVRYQKQLEADAAREKLQVDRRVTTLQCFYRVARAKAQLKRLRKEFVAARAIQCAFRQHLARRRALFIKWTRAAIKVQRAYRLKLLRRKGSRPKRLSDELLAISKKYGGLAASNPDAHNRDEDDAAAGGNANWRVEMDAFDSFKKYLVSRAGKEQLKREEKVMAHRMHEIAKEREKLPPEERMMEDVKDLFELMDVEGTGELSREDTREMMARLRVPLAREEADDVIDMMDNDRSGEISLGEFTNWFFHEYPLLKKRSKDCGVVSRKDWQWVIENSARSALRKQWRALRIGHDGGAKALGTRRTEADIVEGREQDQDDGGTNKNDIIEYLE